MSKERRYRPSVNYGTSWPKQRKLALARDGGACQGPHAPKCRDFAICVHHVKSIQEFNGDTKAANQLDNLLTLCRVCHYEVHNGPAKPLRRR